MCVYKSNKIRKKQLGNQYYIEKDDVHTSWLFKKVVLDSERCAC